MFFVGMLSYLLGLRHTPCGNLRLFSQVFLHIGGFIVPPLDRYFLSLLRI